ncbi:MAG: RDD family protein [Pseudomonadota bacterium]
MDYAGFWMRVVAYFIDAIVLTLIMIPVTLLTGGSLYDTSAPTSLDFSDFFGLIIGVGYFVGMEGSTKQATFGKMAMGLIVTDQQGGRISYARATGRYFGKILSGVILLIGYIMVAFTQRKQGLHDLLAGTLVVRGKPGMAGVDTDVFA